MNFSMDGFRKHLSRDVQDLRDIVEAVVKGESFDNNELIEAMDDVVSQSNIINCVYKQDDPHFSDLSDLQVRHISGCCNDK